VPLSIQPVVAAHLKEATFLLLPHDLGVIAFDAVHVVEEQAHKYQALLVGPGLGQEKETTAFVGALLGLERRDRRSRIGFLSDTAAGVPARPALPPLVVDADGLNALAQSEGWWRSLPPDTILTPHPGEMSRLMGGSVTAAEIQADREGLARRMAAAWSVVVVLKGAFTVVASPAGQVCVVPFANPGLATAGTGDVLAGAVVGLRAQGMAAFDAAVAGAYLHGLAGKLAADQLGDMGMVAGDISVRLPLALKVLRWGGEV
jgi:NAD(P)H-hydrate epimerase